MVSFPGPCDSIVIGLATTVDDLETETFDAAITREPVKPLRWHRVS